MRLLFPITLVLLTACSPPKDPLTSLLSTKESLNALPFPAVVEAATGHRVLPFDQSAAVDASFLTAISTAMPGILARLNAPDSPARKHARINEVSREFEDSLLGALDALPGFTCAIPATVEGNKQRSGYPDLRLLHESSGRVAYLDPKLFEEASVESTLRTFYYEPDSRTGKITEDAHHLLIGIAHDGNEGAWTFLRWHLVDLAGLTIRLKAEFQASNKDLYRPELIISGGEK